jgi:transcriptional regulator with XRE-family HTH domain
VRKENPEYKKVRKRLRSARIALRLTQEEVAEQLNRQQSFVAKVESGARCIDPIELLQFAAIYKLEVLWFLQDVVIDLKRDAPDDEPLDL